MKCMHRKPPEMGYMMAFDDAQERIKRGEKQKSCPSCGLWVWQSYYGPADFQTKAMKGGQCVVMGRHKS